MAEKIYLSSIYTQFVYFMPILVASKDTSDHLNLCESLKSDSAWDHLRFFIQRLQTFLFFSRFNVVFTSTVWGRGERHNILR